MRRNTWCWAVPLPWLQDKLQGPGWVGLRAAQPARGTSSQLVWGSHEPGPLGGRERGFLPMSLLGPASHWLVQVHTRGIVPLRAQAQSCPPPRCGISPTLGASGVQLVGCGWMKGEAQVSRQMETSQPGVAKACTWADSGWALPLPQA